MSVRLLYVLTGPPGTGKSTLCRRVADRARSRGWSVAGLLGTVQPATGHRPTAHPTIGDVVRGARSGDGEDRSPRWPVTAAPLLVDRWVEDLSGGERRLLARYVSSETVAACEPRWRLSDETLAWGDAVLRRSCPTDLLIVDEVGPVELLHRRGWLAGLEVALRGPFTAAVVVVRPFLVPRFVHAWPDAAPGVVDVREPGARVLEDLVAVQAREAVRIERVAAPSGATSGKSP